MAKVDTQVLQNKLEEGKKSPPAAASQASSPNAEVVLGGDNAEP